MATIATLGGVKTTDVASARQLTHDAGIATGAFGPFLDASGAPYISANSFAIGHLEGQSNAAASIQLLCYADDLAGTNLVVLIPPNLWMYNNNTLYTKTPICLVVPPNKYILIQNAWGGGASTTQAMIQGAEV